MQDVFERRFAACGIIQLFVAEARKETSYIHNNIFKEISDTQHAGDNGLNQIAAAAGVNIKKMLH
jgi:hypothetical protein